MNQLPPGKIAMTTQMTISNGEKIDCILHIADNDPDTVVFYIAYTNNKIHEINIPGLIAAADDGALNHLNKEMLEILTRFINLVK